MTKGTGNNPAGGQTLPADRALSSICIGAAREGGRMQPERAGGRIPLADLTPLTGDGRDRFLGYADTRTRTRHQGFRIYDRSASMLVDRTRQ